MEAYPVIFCCHNILSLLLIYPVKGLHKGTSEAPVLPESKRERFPLQPFAGGKVVFL